MNSARRHFLGPLRVESPLGLFAILWAFASALHTLETRPLDGLVLYPFVLILLLKPEHLGAISGFAAVQAVLQALRLPDIANHSMLALLVDTSLLIGCASVLVRKADGDRRRELWNAIRGPIKVTLLAIYFFAVFHKLNSSFFDPAVSCAITQAQKMFALHGFSWRPDPAALSFNIIVTLVAEAMIMTLLLWSRTAFLGALLGLVFHVGLGWARFYDFATVAFALYLFFLPWERIQSAISRMPDWIGQNFVVCGIGVAMSSLIFYGIRGEPILVSGTQWSLTADTIMCLFWTIAIVPMLLPVFWQRGAGAANGRWSGTRLAWIVPAVAIFNGATSYLGLKTVANYSMFSNLRTEGGRSNHYIVPAGMLSVWHSQDELVRVISIERAQPSRWPRWATWTGYSNPRWSSELPNALVPFDEVRRLAHAWRALGTPSVSMVYERGGVRHTVANVFEDKEIMRPMSFLEWKLSAYRAVDEDGAPASCRW